MGCIISPLSVPEQCELSGKSANANAIPIQPTGREPQKREERRKSHAEESIQVPKLNSIAEIKEDGKEKKPRNGSSDSAKPTLIVCGPKAVPIIGGNGDTEGSDRLFSLSSAKGLQLWHLLCSNKGGTSTDSDSESDLGPCHSMFPLGIVSSSSKRRTPSSRAKPLHRFSIDTSRAKSNAPVVSFCARKLGIQEFPSARDDGQACDIYWHSVVYPDMKSVVKAGARVNKFPGMTELAKKIALTQAIRSMREMFPGEYSFYPQSWILPAQMADFREFCAQLRREGDNCFIVKPDDGAQGTGIYLINSPSELQSTPSERQLVQEYVPDPYLLPDQLKFDLRVYAVIRSINPLSIHVAREGMARFCTQKYPGKPSGENFGNLFAHLTNYSLNKGSNAYVHSTSLKEQLRGSKRLLSTVFHQMEHKGVKTRRLWREIKLIIVKTVLAMVPEMMLNYEHQFSEFKAEAPQCFQIMGFDILVRKDGTPVLLEVNSSPSLSVEHSLVQVEAEELLPGGDDPALNVRSIVDEMIKVPLVRDSLLLVLDQLGQFYPEEKERPENKENQQQKWDIRSLYSNGTSLAHSALPSAEDDLGLLSRAKRPHLSEVFPARYGQSSRHMLVLDRVVYLYLQFVSIRQTLLISLPTVRAFLRKCELSSLLPADSLEAKFREIKAYFSSPDAKNVVPSGAQALPFHGFLQIIFHLAKVKFGCEGGQLLVPLLKLLAHCDSALRRYGVHSTRLRRAELVDEEAGQEGEAGRVAGAQFLVKIYLLPSRMPGRRPSEPANEAKKGRPKWRAGQQQQQANRAKSLPRKLVPANGIQNKT